jgi:hypothetical protein
MWVFLNNESEESDDTDEEFVAMTGAAKEVRAHAEWLNAHRHTGWKQLKRSRSTTGHRVVLKTFIWPSCAEQIKGESA